MLNAHWSQRELWDALHYKKVIYPLGMDLVSCDFIGVYINCRIKF